MDWTEMPLLRTPKANRLSSDVQIDMDMDCGAPSIPTALCSALQSFGEGTRHGSQQSSSLCGGTVQCTSDKMGQREATAKSDGVIGITKQRSINQHST
jgi:hypothetical protein